MPALDSCRDEQGRTGKLNREFERVHFFFVRKSKLVLSVVGRFRFGFGFENQSAFFANHFPAIGELAANSQVAYVRTVFGNPITAGSSVSPT